MMASLLIRVLQTQLLLKVGRLVLPLLLPERLRTIAQFTHL
jgi:hypothetical protein